MSSKNILVITGATLYYKKSRLKKKKLSFRLSVAEEDLKTMRTMIKDKHGADVIKLSFETNKKSK